VTQHPSDKVPLLSFAALKEKQRLVRSDFPESLTLRVHRAISWLGRAEKEVDDADVRFILLWIGSRDPDASGKQICLCPFLEASQRRGWV
jgi:hypothetical protein